jgi:hypothetical protein
MPECNEQGEQVSCKYVANIENKSEERHNQISVLDQDAPERFLE